MAFDGVTSFLRLEDVTNICKRMQHSPSLLAGFFHAMAESYRKLKTSNVFSSFMSG